MSVKLPFWATIFTLLGIAVLCTLGNWQLQRLEWKSAIIAKLDAAYESDHSQPLNTENFEAGDFRYGAIEGIFQPGKAILLGPKTKDKEIGYDLIVPLKTKEGTLLVNMGWTEYAIKDLPIHHVKGRNIRFEGLARVPRWNAFTPANEPEEELWFKPDIAEITTVKALKNPLPFMLFAESASYKFDAAFPNNQRWNPNNNHLQYAIFWFAMAGVLAIIYGLRFLPRN